MIPKTIHYCWLSKDPLPTEAQECIKSWKKFMPDYKIKLWDMDAFDVNSVAFVKEAVNARKWAFACDYIRCYALYAEGGIYFDSDVLVRKPIDFVLENRAFSAIESYPDLVEKIAKENLIDEEGNKRDPNSKIHGIQIQAAILGSEKGHPFFKDCLDYYDNLNYHFENGSVPPENMISPIIFASIAEKYGFKYLNKEQQLSESFRLYSSDLFCPQPYLMKKEAVAVHCCNASWRKTEGVMKNALNNAKIYIKTKLVNLGLRREKNMEKLK